MMPTKERLAKKRLRKQRDDAFGPITGEFSVDDFALNKMAEDIGIYTGGLVAFDGEGVPYLHEKTGEGGNDARSDDRKDAALELQRKYQKLWGKHGAAGAIVRKEKRINAELKLSVRTVQQYIKDFPLK